MRAIYGLLNSSKKWTKLTILSIFAQDSEFFHFWKNWEHHQFFRDLMNFTGYWKITFKDKAQPQFSWVLRALALHIVLPKTLVHDHKDQFFRNDYNPLWVCWTQPPNSLQQSWPWQWKSLRYFSLDNFYHILSYNWVRIRS